MLLVIKMGGSILKEGASQDLVADLKEVAKNNKVILVHGGGVEVTEIASKLGKEQKFIISPEGFRSRYTDKETIEIYTMVMAGKINKQIVLALAKPRHPSCWHNWFRCGNFEGLNEKPNLSTLTNGAEKK